MRSTRFHKYEEIGHGNFGHVYRAVDSLTGDIVALKVISAPSSKVEMREMLDREVCTLRQLNTPYIVQCFDHFTIADNFYVVMELCNGPTLEQHLQSTGPFFEATAKKWMKHLIQALVTMRAHRIIHRDLKLANVLLSSCDIDKAECKVCDFGFARILDDGALATSCLGTPISTAPEVLNDQPYDHKVDVWSLGVMLYRMLEGSWPFPARSLSQLRQLQKLPLTFKKASPCAKALILDLLQYDPRNRPEISEVGSHFFFKNLQHPDLDLLQGSTSFFSAEVSLETIATVAMHYKSSSRDVYISLVRVLQRRKEKLKKVRRVLSDVGNTSLFANIDELDIERQDEASISLAPEARSALFLAVGEDELIKAIRSKGVDTAAMERTEVFLNLANVFDERVADLFAILLALKTNEEC